MKRLAFHPLADIFPLLEGAEFNELVASIKANGQRRPVVLLKGMILDGRNRYDACLAAGVSPLLESFKGRDALAYVIDENLRRRHLNESQRAMVAADMARLSQGARNLSPVGEKSQAERAAMVDVGKRTVERAEIVIDEGIPELATAVRHGRISIRAAEPLAQLPVEEQRRVVASTAPDLSRHARTEVKKFNRARREVELAATQAALPDKRYGVILADPEWKFETWGTGGMDRAPENHYPTSSLEVIKSRPVESIAADDCVLFLWATVPMLPQALEVLAAWGFVYKSHFVWVKERESTGYWSRNLHEVLLIGTRGRIPAPAMGTQWPSAIGSEVRGHSVKPDWQYGLVEAYFPTLAKIELNARRRRPGWDAWGNQLPEKEVA